MHEASCHNKIFFWLTSGKNFFFLLIFLLGSNIQQYSLIDPNYHMRNFSMDLMRGTNYNGNGEFVFKNVYFRKNLIPSVKNNKHDLTIVHRTLIEMPTAEERIDLINTLWERTNRLFYC